MEIIENEMRGVKHIIIVSAILLFTISPILSVLIASLIADGFNCELNEGLVKPCMINGKDYGETLSSMFIAGWFIFLSIPAGGFLLVLYPILLLLINRIKKRIH